MPSDSPRIDQEQRECVGALGGLPILDLAREGRRCSEACRLACLVCGNPMALPCEPVYQEAQDALERHEEELEEIRTEVVEGMRGYESMGEMMLKDIKAQFQRKLRQMGMALHPRWGRLVHAGCLRKARGCGCVISRGATGCKEHDEEEAPRAFLLKRQEIPVSVVEPAAVVVVTGSSRTPVVMRKVEWLKPLSEKVDVPMKEDVATVPSARTTTTSVCKRPPPKKVDPRLVQAAAGSIKLDDWIHSAKKADPIKKQTVFDRGKFEKEFDPYLHGHYIENGLRVYRFPDGTKHLVPDGVVSMTDDGYFVSDAGERSTLVTASTVTSLNQVGKKAKPAEGKACQRLRIAAGGCAKLDKDSWTSKASL